MSGRSDPFQRARRRVLPNRARARSIGHEIVPKRFRQGQAAAGREVGIGPPLQIVRKSLYLRQTGMVWRLILLWLVVQLFNYPEALRWLAPEVMGLSMSPDRVIFVALFAVLIVGRLNPHGGARLRNSPAGIMFAFFAMCMISWYFAGSDVDRNRWLVTIFQLSVFPFCVYLLTRQLPFDCQRIGQLQSVFLAMACYFAVTGIAEHYGTSWLVWPQYILDPSIGLTPGRARGPLLNTADQGWVLLGGAAIVCMRIPRNQGRSKLLLVGLLGLYSLATYFTYTRSTWLAFGAAVLTASWLRRQAGGMRVASALVAVGLLFTISGIASQLSWHEPTLFSRRQNTVDYRKTAMSVAWEVTKANPLVGIGYGTLGNNLEQYTPEGSGRLDDGNHNLFLGLAAELGIVGLSLYLAIFCALMKQLWVFRRRLSNNDPVLQDLSALAVAMTVAFFLFSQFGDWRFHVLPHNYLFIIFGLCAAVGDHSEVRKTTRAPARPLIHRSA